MRRKISKSSKYRTRAADKIRAARRAGNKRDQNDKMQVAMALKAIAATEEWLAGEEPRSSFGREPKPDSTRH